MIYGGDGLARSPVPSPNNDRGQGKAVFVPRVLSGETVQTAITDEKAGFSRGQATEIITPSPYRTPPPCPHFGNCGGCQYQHAVYTHQLEIKKEILRENLRRIAKIELQCEIQVHPSPPLHYRNRSRLQVRTRPQFAAGYFKLASHELFPIEECPISSPLINRGIATLWQAGRAGKVVEGVREIEFFARPDAAGNEQQLLIEIYCTGEARRAPLRSFAEELCAAMPEISGVVVFREAQKAVYEPLITVGAAHVTYETKTGSWRVSAGSFFQTNRFLTDELIEIVSSGATGTLALDLYAGVGLFSTAIARNFRQVISVESSATAASDLGRNLPANARAVQMEAETYLMGKTAAKVVVGESHSATHPPSNGKAADLILVDPPRSGLGDRMAMALAAAKASRITYVSCDPATLARDLIPLRAAGYRVEQIHLIDLFPQTYHLESVTQFVL